MNTIELSCELNELYRLNEFLEDILAKEDFQVKLIAEEVFVNIVNYSHTDLIKVNANYENSILTFEFVDEGFEFNPLLKEEIEMPESIEEAKIGGLGIHLTKEFSDSITYERKNNENHLIITKKVE